MTSTADKNEMDQRLDQAAAAISSRQSKVVQMELDDRDRFLATNQHLVDQARSASDRILQELRKYDARMGVLIKTYTDPLVVCKSPLHSHLAGVLNRYQDLKNVILMLGSVPRELEDLAKMSEGRRDKGLAVLKGRLNGWKDTQVEPLVKRAVDYVLEIEGNGENNV